MQARVHALDDAGAVCSRRWKQQQKQQHRASASEAPGSIAAQGVAAQGAEQRGGAARGGGERWRSTPHQQHSTGSLRPYLRPVLSAARHIYSWPYFRFRVQGARHSKVHHAMLVHRRCEAVVAICVAVTAVLLPGGHFICYRVCVRVSVCVITN